MTTDTRTTHTPGPWHVESPSNVMGNATIRTESGSVIAIMPNMTIDANPMTRFDDPANGAVLAAAPDLLAALKLLVAHVDSLARRHEMTAADHGALNLRLHESRAAINKAKGQ